jgi:MoaA/NifB/PqqE/SkfB family radical SAM enzyme
MVFHARLIEIEIHNYCNRSCAWCPNNKIERGKFQVLPLSVYCNVLESLASQKYSGTISYSRYNEPLFDLDLLSRYTGLARKIVPRARLVMNTNGDFLDIKSVFDAGIDELSIMDYDCHGLNYCKGRLGEADVEILKENGSYLYGVFKSLKVVYCVDWPLNNAIYNRGGFFKTGSEFESEGQKKKVLTLTEDGCQRDRICMEPTYFIGIDFNGCVTPCCHIRSDNPAHQPFILGNVKEGDIVAIYNSSGALRMRKMLTEGHSVHFPDPCRYCRSRGGRYTRAVPSIKF